MTPLVTVELSTIVAGVIGVLVTAAASVVVALIARGTGREGNAIMFSRDLMGRIEALEKRDRERNAELAQKDALLSDAVRLVLDYVRWTDGGHQGPEPRATHRLQAVLDAESTADDAA